MIVLGIDPGLANTGWGVIETRGSVARARAYGCIHTQADEPLHERLGQICAQIEQAISRYEPGSVAIEDIFFGAEHALGHPHGPREGGGARGVLPVRGGGCQLHAHADQAGRRGTGAADKRQVTYMVRTVLALDHDPKPDHCADALAAAVCHANLSRTFAMSAAQGGAAARTLARTRSGLTASTEHDRRVDA